MNLTARSVRGRQVQWVEAVEVSAMQHRTKMDYGARDLTGSSLLTTSIVDCEGLEGRDIFTFLDHDRNRLYYR